MEINNVNRVLLRSKLKQQLQITYPRKLQTQMDSLVNSTLSRNADTMLYNYYYVKQTAYGFPEDEVALLFEN